MLSVVEPDQNLLMDANCVFVDYLLVERHICTLDPVMVNFGRCLQAGQMSDTTIVSSAACRSGLPACHC